MGVRGKRYAAVSALEFGRVKKDSLFDVVLPLEAHLERAAKAWPGQRPNAARVIALLAKELGAGTLTVPEDFFAGLYQQLRDLGIKVGVPRAPCSPSARSRPPPRPRRSARATAAARPGSRPRSACSAPAGSAAAGFSTGARP